MDVEKIIRQVLSDGKEQPCIFDRIVERMESYNDAPVHTYLEMRQRDNKAIKGLAWEEFCQWYLLKVKKYDKVWLWKEIPEEVKQQLGLKIRADNGIDIVAQRYGKYTAVQCKFKKRQIAKGRKTVKVSWKTLSTFLGLVSRSGPWEQHIVMTNCHGVGKWQIPRSPKDKTIAYGTFKNLTRLDCVSEGISVDEVVRVKSDVEIRAARLAIFDKKM